MQVDTNSTSRKSNVSMLDVICCDRDFATLETRNIDKKRWDGGGTLAHRVWEAKTHPLSSAVRREPDNTNYQQQHTINHTIKLQPTSVCLSWKNLLTMWHFVWKGPLNVNLPLIQSKYFYLGNFSYRSAIFHTPPVSVARSSWPLFYCLFIRIFDLDVRKMLILFSGWKYTFPSTPKQHFLSNVNRRSRMLYKKQNFFVNLAEFEKL